MPITPQEMVFAAQQQLENINITEAHELLQTNQVVALDVREKVEFDAGHITDAVHISRGLLEFLAGNHPQLADRTQPILVYCKSGGRSALAGATLKQLGYTRVLNLEGGFDAWTQGQNVPEQMSD